MYLEKVIDYALSQIKDRRSINSIFYLLKGKKSIQTIHDAEIFQLERFFGIHKTLHIDTFEAVIQQMRSDGLIMKGAIKDSFLSVTEIEKVPTDFRAYFNGLKFESIAPTFMNRLLLLIQTYTNSQMKNKSFIPIIDIPDIIAWVKYFYRQNKNREADILPEMYHELHCLLQYVDDMEASLFVDRLTGYQHYGMSTGQLKEKYKISKDDVILLHTAVVHKMISLIHQEKKDYPLLQGLVDYEEYTSILTASAQKTFRFFKMGLTVEEISRKRGLKKNTIYDHMVEIALHEQEFPFHQFVDEQAQPLILQAIKTNPSHRLRDIRSTVGDSISYFQIRLMLTKFTRLTRDKHGKQQTT
ncbi:helix-turn-helix domain-containing protein [Virgibacillus sp. MG-45]|uniref:helix-turn-helix domain-containing protein n=1 Tax=Virgibacillus sp. MG-45 TaxID=3102791 RepID=UPI002ED925FD